MEEKEIYPGIWESEGKEALEYLMFYYDQVVTFYLDAAHQNRAAILWIN